MLSVTLHSQLTAHTQAQVYGVLAMMQRRNAPVNYLYFMQACDENDMAVLDLYGLS